MSVEAVQSGNDHGFIFKRGRALTVKALGARVANALTPAPAPAHSTTLCSTPANKRTAALGSTHLDFPTSKRRLTTAALDHTVPVEPPTQPTPLIARTRTKHSTPSRRRTTQLRRNPRKSMRRRSTFSMRGKRASSIGGGFKAIPHDSVSTQDFYRHISPELPEPVRLRQLLAWCARRTAVAPEWPNELPDHVQQLLSDVYKEAADDVHSALERGEIATSWYHRPTLESGEKPGILSTAESEARVHPENVANAEARDTLVARIARLQRENDAWVRELRRAGTEHARVLDRLPPRVQTAVLTARSEPIAQLARPLAQIDWTPATQNCTHAAEYVQSGAVDDELQEAEEQIAQATRELEVRLDAVHVDMHRAHESHKNARSQCARVRADVGFVFDVRRERAQAVATADGRPASKDRDSTRDLLRTLASALSS
ncbi:hypothetical protein IW147_005203 [Coemansia sp. RSA 720]|nr:hypothetical protein IW147_005203 [Coemansia sp. RSA 720]